MGAAAQAARRPATTPLIAGNPASALMLAADLARLMDDMTTRQVSWDKLNGLVPPEMDQHWEISFQFLKFVRQHWPAILEGAGKIEPAERRDKLIEAERARLAKSPGPVIAAGSTGSMPATAALLETIAKLPHGAVVLPGLDTDLDEPSWQTIGGDDDAAHGHPQFAMHALLRRIGIARDAVTALAPPAPHGRERFASEALRPAAASELWRTRLDARRLRRPRRRGAQGHRRGRSGQRRGGSARHRRSRCARRWKRPGKTAALVTPDRALARRVLAALSRWNVPVDDSGGDALADTPVGVFARLVGGGCARRPRAGEAACHAQASAVPDGCAGGGRRWSARSCAGRGRRRAPKACGWR